MNIKNKYYYSVPLRTLVHSMPNKTPEKVQQMYGELGVKILKNETKASILEKKDKTTLANAINKIKGFLGMNTKEDYQPKDTLHEVMFKYLGNKNSGTTKEIKDVFGQKGAEHFEDFKILGYIDV